MLVFKKDFLFGLVVGAAITMVVLEMWGSYLQRSIMAAAQPRLLQPLIHGRSPQLPKTSEILPRPWVPETSSRLHDDWRFRPLDGKPLTLAGLKGNVVFLNFWSTTCAPCIAEMPGIERLYDSLKNERVAFLMLAQDEDVQRIREFLKATPVKIPVYLGSKDLPKDLPVQGVPTAFILDSNGRAVFRHVGGLNWDDENVRKYIRSLEER